MVHKEGGGQRREGCRRENRGRTFEEGRERVDVRKETLKWKIKDERGIWKKKKEKEWKEMKRKKIKRHVTYT